MTTDLALSTVGHADGTNNLGNWNYWDGYGAYPTPTHYWWPYTVPTVWPVINIVTGHRTCGCPNCAGDCCDCADCKVKRLERRVAELEKRGEE